MSDIVTTQIFSNGEVGITATKMNNIVGQASVQTDFVASKPLASSVAANDQLLLLTAGGTYARTNFSTVTSSVSGTLVPAGVGQAGIMNALSGNATDYVSGANTCLDLATAVKPTIWTARRAFNAVGNSTFECDQRLCFAVVPSPNGFVQDRWQVVSTSGTASATYRSIVGVVGIPGTLYDITQRYAQISINTAQPSLGATDYWILQQIVEGPNWRELAGGPTSISLLVSSTVAGLKFSVFLKSGDLSTSYVLLCTIPSANTWTMISLPNIAQPPSSFTVAAGTSAYVIGICLACGTNNIAPSTGSWVSGNYVGASGMSNLFNSTSNLFYCAFVQHEPGPEVTGPIDLPFGANLDGPMGCTRYYNKSYDYPTAIGTVTYNGAISNFMPINTTGANGYVQFPKRMARRPITIALYSPNTGAPNTAWDPITNANPGAFTTQYGDAGINQFTGSGYTIGRPLSIQYTSDTGW